MQQQTLNSPISFSGKGLHTGQEVTLTLHPAPAGSGYRIRRSDLEGTPEFAAFADLVTHTNRCTELATKECSVATVEHALSALYAMGVDNCTLEVNGPEFPILTGNAMPYVEAIKQVGVVAQTEDREYYVVKKTMEVCDEETGARLLLFPDETSSIEVHLSYETNPPGRQQFVFAQGDSYEELIAPARSYVLVSEIMPLLAKGLVKGGSITNALIIKDRPLTADEEGRLREQLPDCVLPEGNGYLNPATTNAENEPARHKVLDLLGDLSLAGRFIKGRLIAFKPGHGVNNLLARKLRAAIKQQEAQEPCYDPDQEPVMDISAIKELLPHRYPFLLVDKIIEMGHTSIVGVKSVTGNEPFFIGHFPEEPVMPGVLIVEAMAQTGGLLVINALRDQGKWSTYLLKIDKVKFRRKVVPGDTLLFKLKLMTEIRRGIAVMRGLAFVGSRLVCEAEFTAQIVNESAKA